jgi:Holliday junction resolvase
MRAKRVDVNQREIVQALRKCGAVVHDLSGVGAGCPDLLVGYRGKTVLVEVKRDSKAKYTKAQIAWNEAWRGGLVARVESIDDVIGLLNAD